MRIVDEYTDVGLYTCENLDRGRYDFACIVRHGLTQLIVGQVLWKNTDGVAKDVSSLLLEERADVRVLVARDDAPTRARVAGAVAEYQRSHRFDDRLHRLVIIQAPDFDADDAAQREAVTEALREQILDDVLLRVVLGELLPRDVAFFCHMTNSSIRAGWDRLSINLRLLRYVRDGRFVSYGITAEDLGVGPARLREGKHILFGAGFIEPVGGDLVMTARGRTFTTLIDRLVSECNAGRLSTRLLDMFDRIGCSLDDIVTVVPRVVPGTYPFRPAHYLISALAQFTVQDDPWRLESDLVRLLVEARPHLRDAAVAAGYLRASDPSI
jgi:Fe-S-cluster formation regulator IscX/YfhJ